VRDIEVQSPMTDAAVLAADAAAAGSGAAPNGAVTAAVEEPVAAAVD
jgi:hypothetical protein